VVSTQTTKKKRCTKILSIKIIDTYLFLRMRRTYSFIIFFLCVSYAVAQTEVDILIKGGRILDGTGNSWFYGDVAIKQGKILKLGKLEDYKAKKIIDARGLIVAPGFIDVHTHIEDDEVRNPTADNFIYDGVTTVITGNCGLSNVDIKKYLLKLDSLRLSINVATFIGHNDVRRAVMGTANRKATGEEQKKNGSPGRESHAGWCHWLKHRFNLHPGRLFLN
jgi:N-acyl-D-amino-acid deacylase